MPFLVAKNFDWEEDCWRQKLLEVKLWEMCLVSVWAILSFVAFFWGPGQQLPWWLRSPGSVVLWGDSPSLSLQQLESGLQKEYYVSFGNSAKKERKSIIWAKYLTFLVGWGEVGRGKWKILYNGLLGMAFILELSQAVRNIQLLFLSVTKPL